MTDGDLVFKRSESMPIAMVVNLIRSRFCKVAKDRNAVNEPFLLLVCW